MRPFLATRLPNRDFGLEFGFKLDPFLIFFSRYRNALLLPLSPDAFLTFPLLLLLVLVADSEQLTTVVDGKTT